MHKVQTQTGFTEIHRRHVAKILAVANLFSFFYNFVPKRGT